MFRPASLAAIPKASPNGATATAMDSACLSIRFRPLWAMSDNGDPRFDGERASVEGTDDVSVVYSKPPVSASLCKRTKNGCITNG